MLLGPLFRFELVRLARRGTHLPLRVVLAALLFVGLLAAYLQLFPGTDVADLLFAGSAADPSQLDKFGETFLVAFLIIQQVAVLLLTPVYAGGSVAEEKEKGRLDFLLTAPLGRWEIVFGKLAARLVFVLAVIAVGLPVVAFTLLFGGVDPDRVLASFAVAGVTAVALASFSVMISVLRPTLREVLLWVYFALAASGLVGLFLQCVTPLPGVGGILSPATVLIPILRAWAEPIPPTGDPTWTLVGVYAFIYMPLSGVFVVVAVANVREAVRRPTDTPMSATPPGEPEPSRAPGPTATEPAPSRGATPAEPPLPAWYKLPERPVFAPDDIPSAADGRDFLVPGLGDREDPLSWKERHFGAKLPLVEGRWFGFLRGCAVVVFLFLLGAVLFIGLASTMPYGRGPGEVIGVLARLVLVVAVLVLPFAGLRTATSIAEERAKKTLDSLLTLPLERPAILWAKVRAAVHRSRWWLIGAFFASTTAVLTGGVHLFCVPGLAAVFAGYGVFTVGLGAWLGVRCKTGVRAVLTHVVVTLATLFGPLIAGPLVGPPAYFLSPPVTLVLGAVPSLDERGIRWNSDGWAVCLAIPVGLTYAVAGLIAWALAEKRFDAEGRG